MKIDFFEFDIKPTRLREVGDSLSAPHGLFQAVSEQFDIFLVAIECQAAFRHVFGELLVMILDQIEKPAAKPRPHYGIDHQFEGVCCGI
jgi:hypothetical protein